jgi:hypothetical protein
MKAAAQPIKVTTAQSSFNLNPTNQKVVDVVNFLSQQQTIKPASQIMISEKHAIVKSPIVTKQNKLETKQVI